MDKWTDRHANRWKDKQTDKKRKIDRQTHGKMNRHKDRET
jgi:hypothetical protein